MVFISTGDISTGDISSSKDHCSIAIHVKSKPQYIRERAKRRENKKRERRTDPRKSTKRRGRNGEEEDPKKEEQESVVTFLFSKRLHKLFCHSVNPANSLRNR